MQRPHRRTLGPKLAALWPAALLALVSALIWCAHEGRWTRESWQLPTEYGGDVPEILAQMQAAGEGAMWPLRPKVVDRLGAPFGAHWNAYPTPDKPLMLFVGALAQGIGLFAAANVGLLLLPVGAALAFFLVARWLGSRWEWAFAGGLLFAFSYQTIHRGLGHISIANTWMVPLGLLAAGLVAKSRRLEWHRPEAVVCLGAGVAFGISNPYYLLFWLQLMGWALIAHWFDRRRGVNLAIGLATIAVAGLVFVASHLEVWLYVQEPEGAPLLARNYSGTEIYALKPVEMVIPPTFHRWDALAFFGHRYVRWSLWRGEGFLPYLGIFGIAALLWLGALTARRIFTRRAIPGQAAAVGWLVFYAALGGLTNVLALLAGFQMFRATNRVVVFISAILLMFLVGRLSRLTWRWPRWAQIGAAFAIAGVGVADQVPREATEAQRAEIAATVRSDQALGRALEAALPPGAMVFQLPVLGFPEVPPPFRLADYELFRPYLVTDTLRFSYGAAKFRARSRWQRDIEGVPTEILVRRLEAYGFAALYINRRGFEDGGERLLKELKGLGYEQKISSPRGQQVVVLLRPREKPIYPLGRALTFGQGWHPPGNDGIRWAYDDGIMSYFNPYDHPITADLRLTVMGVSPRTLVFEHAGHVVRSAIVDKAPVEMHFPGFKLAPGVNRMALRSGESAVRLGTGRNQLRTFGLQNPSIIITAPVKMLE